MLLVEQQYMTCFLFNKTTWNNDSKGNVTPVYHSLRIFHPSFSHKLKIGYRFSLLPLCPCKGKWLYVPMMILNSSRFMVRRWYWNHPILHPAFTIIYIYTIFIIVYWCLICFLPFTSSIYRWTYTKYTQSNLNEKSTWHPCHVGLHQHQCLLLVPWPPCRLPPNGNQVPSGSPGRYTMLSPCYPKHTQYVTPICARTLLCPDID